MPECICRGDPRVRVLLGKQRRPLEGGRIRKSQFVYSLYVEGKYLLFHTLTRQFLVMPPQYIDYFTDGRLFPLSVLEQELPAKLYEEYFLVPEHSPESQTYLELKDVFALKEELPKGITHYVILPTTTCNARCFYCFEQGMRYHKADRSARIPHHHFSVHNDETDLSVADQGIPVGQDNVGVFSRLQASDPILHADVSGWVDGDRLQRLERIHASFDREPCAQGEVLLRDYRRVRDDGDLYSGGR